MKTPPTKPSPVAMCPVRCSPFNGLVAAVLLLSAAGSGLTQPVIVTHPRDQTVALGTTVSFIVSVSGTSPLTYQWRFEAVDLPGATNWFLNVPNVQLTNAGGYTLLLSNLAGAVTSRVAQLSVAGGGVFTNAQGTRLPYRLCLPPRYDPGTEYPLVLFWHGAGEVGTDNTGQLKDGGQFSFLTASNLAKFPCFYLAPQLPNYPGSSAEACRFTDCATNLLRRLQEEYSIDPDRIYVTGLSMGGQLSWSMLARYPDLLAAVVPMSASWIYHSREDFLQSLRVPVWNFHAANDDVVGVGGSDAAVAALRGAGASIVYTRYQSGRHAIWPTAYSAPVLVDWIMAQRRGVAPTNEPLLSIASPTAEATYVNGVATLDVAGAAGALGQPIFRVEWTNTATHGTGVASGLNLWSVTGVPLALPDTNLLIVTAATTSWSAGYGGTTTFNDTLTIIPASLRVTWVPDPVALDCDLTYTLTVANSSPRTATGVVVSNSLPSEVRFVSATASQGSCAHSQGVVTCELGSLAVLATATITIVVQPASLGPLANFATVTAHEPEFTSFAPAIATLTTARLLAEPPQSQTVRAGTNLTFSVRAPCGPQTTYQWHHNSLAIPGANGATLTLTNVQVPDEGSYTVRVTHPTGSVLSDPATLVVLVSPVAIRPPLSQSVVERGSVTFSVEIEGNPPPFLYSWRRGALVLTNLVRNERTCFFTLTNVQTSQGGGHRLVVANAGAPAGAALATFTLTVLADTDTDGLPDTWETACGIDQASAHHGLADDDSDGLCNGAEYLAGTNPTNALSYLKVDTITLANAGAAAVLQFFAVSNKTYTVQYREKVDGGEWNRLTDVVATASNRVLAVSDQPGGANGRYYRLLTPRHP